MCATHSTDIVPSDGSTLEPGLGCGSSWSNSAHAQWIRSVKSRELTSDHSSSNHGAASINTDRSGIGQAPYQHLKRLFVDLVDANAKVDIDELSFTFRAHVCWVWDAGSVLGSPSASVG